MTPGQISGIVTLVVVCSSPGSHAPPAPVVQAEFHENVKTSSQRSIFSLSRAVIKAAVDLKRPPSESTHQRLPDSTKLARLERGL
ncbi:hypothetical protein CI41S_30400 [Bradyrhizobium ivorense]|nr:hypothetical protein CI41S_30400 [Bradyrhizobium ivorense]